MRNRRVGTCRQVVIDRYIKVVITSRYGGQSHAEVDPPVKAIDVVRVNVIDLAKHGQSHSCYVKELDEIIATK